MHASECLFFSVLIKQAAEESSEMIRAIRENVYLGSHNIYIFTNEAISVWIHAAVYYEKTPKMI